MSKTIVRNIRPDEFVKRAVCRDKKHHLYKELHAPLALFDGAVSSDGYRAHFAPGATGDGDAKHGSTLEMLTAFIKRQAVTFAKCDGAELLQAARATRTMRSSKHAENFARDDQIEIFARPGVGLLLVGKSGDLGTVKALVPCEVTIRTHILLDATFLIDAIAAENVRLAQDKRHGNLYVYSGKFVAVIVPCRKGGAK